MKRVFAPSYLKLLSDNNVFAVGCQLKILKGKKMKRILILVVSILAIFQLGCGAGAVVFEWFLGDMPRDTADDRCEIDLLEREAATKEAIDLLDKIGGKYVRASGGNLARIEIDGKEITDETIDIIKKQIVLEELIIKNVQDFGDDKLLKFKSMGQLTKLSLVNVAITDKSVELLVDNLPNNMFQFLRKLDLSRNNSLTDESISHISKFQVLEELVLVGCSFTEAKLSELLVLKNLRALDIRGNLSIGNKGLEVLSGLESLRSFKHSSPAVDDAGVSAMIAAKNLETFDIQDFSMSSDAGKSFNKMPKLTSLIIYRCTNFGSAGLDALRGKQLKRLTLRDLPAVDDSGLAAFRELSSLKRLYLQEMDSISDEGARNLIYLKELETLEIRNMPVLTDKTAEYIARLTNLKSISIIGTQLTDKTIDAIMKLPKLQEVTLKGNNLITPDATNNLRNSKKFQKLQIID
ncbi:MAG: hypothetical protein LBJ00_02060 [Planctomycetaceae bacterium]|jgi:Leucine-rich repeat (LRR) protein|nr:hypothetical protein [Planctomycetaceae bacterium]